jgi:CAAX protease family protein
MSATGPPASGEASAATATGRRGPFAGAVFLNAEGLRAGWRLLLFVALTSAMLFLLGRLSRLLGLRIAVGIFGPLSTIEGESLLFFSLLAAAAVMARLERRSLAHYALPLKGAFGRRFWQGAVWGLAALSLLIIVIWLGHGYAFGPVVLVGRDLFRYAGLWALAFLAVGFFEEFSMRGYALFTMTTGIGFWLSAILLSTLFGAIHLGNARESWVGGLSAGLIGLFFCLTVRRTGSLWFAIGFHAAWDYGESFVYSVPDSGIVVPGHLMDSSFRGPNWLTGGYIGPEGSVFVFVLIGLLWLAFDRLNPDVRFPAARAAALSTSPCQAPSAPIE